MHIRDVQYVYIEIYIQHVPVVVERARDTAVLTVSCKVIPLVYVHTIARVVDHLVPLHEDGINRHGAVLEWFIVVVFKQEKEV